MSTHKHLYKHIPEEYRQYWEPYKTDKVLLHLTTRVNFENIKKVGHIEPRDPFPKHWAGIKAIFLADPDDPLYAESLKYVLAHVKEKHKGLLRLHIKTKNDLYKSKDPARTFQVMSLSPIYFEDIIEIENLQNSKVEYR
ncbi:hypothetical protein A3H10_00950 [Candidatus Uhrbacteria bacterium RIFCSPLOWO2_12_FULL_46_10]|uniref:Uncharacterized protein n=1 Tax=Candidatus Uhrbacteria bacterium RIFCSPLOWO2_01_FULL_47_25 TaxID=1802402 RepID=A0A1F7US84_9BACT|nr:MAG: hypothetical protein UX68_C0010G0060 [Parcubacteria group bacterium GW2011_GWA2_46_9]OGL59272.1 MAG: hypothetical protein A2752_01215 [Candidatus Uhrbacteria bacterium RIFCSPHIGHO2_01_FULL_46_23]OGL68483.1 MAG: hypothetical protein A3D60_02600 [Candidatus Uhrbacteria bacterium RIFCSPHIGHO2_02_FULL_47_29]OGL75590.1 MAG: hypothetical protein A3E96_00935 [Candidatus Uhrbacteria bacterium RIFCSPHIGHO2_12_FULL_46_13]OGL81105.1 MAG: hypothetical protein A2936_00700 [Candidatus Uhrbacteria bac